MDLKATLVRRFGNRIWLAYKRQLPILKFFSRFQQVAKYDRDRLDRYRLERLRKLLIHAGSTSQYYRSLFSQMNFKVETFNSFAALEKLPFLTKDILNEQMERILSSGFKRSELVKSSTGGSSGVPLTFYRDHVATNVRRAQDEYFNRQIGIYPGCKRAWIWGSAIDAFSLARLKAKIMNFLTERAIYFCAFDATPEKMREFLTTLTKHCPEVIFAYPNMLTTLAQLAQNEECKIVNVPKIVVTAEPLYDFQRQLFREVFGAEVYERYGSREIGTVAAEGKCHNGMHLFEPCYYFEVVDSAGKSIDNGQIGELVVTDFHNYAMPLIRYRTGDMASIDSRACICGSIWSRLTKMGGRIVDMLLRTDGSQFAGEGLIRALRLSGVKSQVQLVQLSPLRLQMRYLSSQPIESRLQNEFQKLADELFRTTMEIEYVAVDKLGYDKSGKYRYVVCEC